MEKAWFMAPVECNFNGKGILVPIEYIIMVYSVNGKGMDLWKMFFEVVIVVVKEVKNTA